MGLTLILLALAFSASSCGASRVTVRGNSPDPERVAELKPGLTSKDDILDSLGSPSSINTFGKETWYYITEKTETVAFFEPTVLERQILVIEFDAKGKMAQIVTVGLDAGKEIAQVERITPTFGEELTLIEQLVGNFRRFVGDKDGGGGGDDDH